MTDYVEVDAVIKLLDTQKQTIAVQSTTIDQLRTTINEKNQTIAELTAQLEADQPQPTFYVGAACTGGTTAAFEAFEAQVGALDAVRIFISGGVETNFATAVANKIAPHKGKRTVFLSIAWPVEWIKEPNTQTVLDQHNAVNNVLMAHKDLIYIADNHEPFVKVNRTTPLYSAEQWVNANILWLGRYNGPNVKRLAIHTADNFRTGAINTYSPPQLLMLLDGLGADGYDWGTPSTAEKIFQPFLTWCKNNNKEAHATELGFDHVIGTQDEKILAGVPWLQNNGAKSALYFHVQDDNAISHTTDKHICKWPLQSQLSYDAFRTVKG